LNFARPCHLWTMCGYTAESNVGDDVVVPWEGPSRTGISGFPYRINVPLGPALGALGKIGD
jgi:hypothetical protein